MSTLSPTLTYAFDSRRAETARAVTPIWRSAGTALGRVVAAIIAHRQARADAEVARRMAWRG